MYKTISVKACFSTNVCRNESVELVTGSGTKLGMLDHIRISTHAQVNFVSCYDQSSPMRIDP